MVKLDGTQKVTSSAQDKTSSPYDMFTLLFFSQTVNRLSVHPNRRDNWLQTSDGMTQTVVAANLSLIRLDCFIALGLVCLACAYGTSWCWLVGRNCPACLTILHKISIAAEMAVIVPRPGIHDSSKTPSISIHPWLTCWASHIWFKKLIKVFFSQGTFGGISLMLTECRAVRAGWREEWEQRDCQRHPLFSHSKLCFWETRKKEKSRLRDGARWPSSSEFVGSLKTFSPTFAFD